MNKDPDSKDKKEARTLAIVLVAMLVVLAVAAVFTLPLLGDIAATQLEPGLGLKNAAVIAFFTTVVLIIVFALAAGDSLIGEIQFMLPGFFAFFIVIWLLLAWIF